MEKIKNKEDAKPLQSQILKSGNQEPLELKKELDLIDGVALLVGVMIGAGIFVAPKGVLLYSGSIGIALFWWLISGLICLVGALCYAELGTMIPKSGGDFAYIMTAFGGLPAFLFLWVTILIIAPCGNAILALTFTNYLLQPFYTETGPSLLAVRVISALAIVILTSVNCYDVKCGARLQSKFAIMKIFAVLVIIIVGMVVLFMGKTQNLRNPLEGTNYDAGHISLALYSGLFSYSGWSLLNFVVEELKEPSKNLPRAIWISLPSITIIFTLVNLAYFVVLPKAEILKSSAVAATFGKEVLGFLQFIMPLFVASSTFGGLNGQIFAPSRLVFVASREHYLPRALSIINADTYTPIPALSLIGILSVSMLLVDDVYTLINYTMFAEALFMGMSVFGLIWLRFKDPDAVRPVKVPIIYPILFSAVCMFLVAVPIVTAPISEIGMSTLIILSGIPVYLIFIRWENKPKFFSNLNDSLYYYTAKLCNGVDPNSKSD